MDKIAKYITDNMNKITWTRSQGGNADGTLGPYTIRLMAEVVLIVDTERPLIWARMRDTDLVNKLWQCTDVWFVNQLVRLLPADERRTGEQP